MKITSAHGTPEQFEAAVRKRIQELNKEDEIITSAADPDTEIADRDEYITALYHELKAAAPDSISINIEDEDDDSISFVASDGDRVVSFKVPYADMKFDWTHFEDDVDYILTAVNEEFAADGMSDTHNTDAASNILASLQFTDDYEYDTLSAIEDDNITLFNKLKNYPELIKGDEVIIPKGTKLIYDRTDEYYKYYKLPEYGNLRIRILADEYTDFSHHIGTSDETFAKYVDKLNSGVRRFSVKWADVKDFEKYLKDHNISYDTGYGGKASVPFIIKSTVKHESLKASVDNDVTELRDGTYEYRSVWLPGVGDKKEVRILFIEGDDDGYFDEPVYDIEVLIGDYSLNETKLAEAIGCTSNPYLTSFYYDSAIHWCEEIREYFMDLNADNLTNDLIELGLNKNVAIKMFGEGDTEGDA